MTEPVWLDTSAVLYLHDVSLASHGGSPGVRDPGLLESALARPLNLHAYEGETGLPRLAAAYASGIVRNHPFVDGNKRTGFAAAGVFLEANGLMLIADIATATNVMIRLAAGEMNETEFAVWLAQAI